MPHFSRLGCKITDDLVFLSLCCFLVLGKADLTKYREAGAEVISVLCQFERCVVERASIDEAYIDLTDRVNYDVNSDSSPPVTHEDLPHTFIVGGNDGKWLFKHCFDLKP